MVDRLHGFRALMWEMAAFRRNIGDLEKRLRWFEGVALEQARKEAGLSLRDVARQLGVSHVTVKQWESGERPVPADHYFDLLDIIDPVRGRGRKKA